ncbi:signal peptidase I [Sphingomonas glacialis]|uniref:Signal peptidase I n=1 Tax=Sphingomonas glacialis TaxID=658225 RepID=A0A502FWX7_9SPHN|nr:signal peptidase I [Sphingomonas glacialis]
MALSHGARIGRTFYIPSQSMLPTLEVNDRLAPLRFRATELRRGVVVVFKTQGEIRAARIAAIGGDTIEMQNGVVAINGKVADQRLVGIGPSFDGTASRMLEESFPGEQGSHRILDIEPGLFDSVAAVRVDAGKLFLLGDNRDRAADSRVSLQEMGVEQVRVGDVLGIVDSVYWSPTRSKIGRPIDDWDQRGVQ